MNTSERCRYELNNVILTYSIKELCGTKKNIVYKYSESYRFEVVFDIRGPLYKVRPPLWSSGQSVWLLTQGSRVGFTALPDFSEQQWVWNGVHSAS
jgi:hypothetical protein